MNKYKVIIRNKKNGDVELEFYRWSSKGHYKNTWEYLIIARDKSFKELKLNKHWFVSQFCIDITYLKEIEDYCKLKGFEFETK